MATVTIAPDFNNQVEQALLPHWRQVAGTAESMAKAMAAKRTGRFATSISGTAAPGGVMLASSSPYGHFLEYGTRKMRAQPALRPALIGAVTR